MSLPPALKHGSLEQVFPDVFYVRGSMKMNGAVAFSRAMTVVREGDELVLINSMRLGEEGLAELDALGKVAHVLSIAGFHGRDDAFYKERYGAKIWDLEGHIYAKGFNENPAPSDAYFAADAKMNAETPLPLSGARLHVFDTKTPEAIVVLDREGGVLVTGDSLQNWATTDEYFTWMGKAMMKVMGFIKPYNLGPGWLKAAKPTKDDIRALLDLPFDHVLPAHGTTVIGDAREKFRPAIERFCS